MNTECENPSAAFEFETERLRVRLLDKTDERLFCRLYTDAEVMRFIGPPLSTERAARSFQTALRLTQRLPPQHLFLTMFCKSTSESVGICSVQGAATARRSAEAGMIIPPAARGIGFAKEGLVALVTRSFSFLPIDEVWAQVAVENLVAERVVIGVGFSPTGELASAPERPEQRIWSVSRQSWFRRATIK